MSRRIIVQIFKGSFLQPLKCTRHTCFLVRVRPREFFSRLIFHDFPIKTLPQNAKCRRSSALDLTSRTLPRFRCRFDSDRPLHFPLCFAFRSGFSALKWLHPSCISAKWLSFAESPCRVPILLAQRALVTLAASLVET